MNDRNLEASSEFMRVAGLRLEEIGGGRVRGSIEWGVVHGGIYTAAVQERDQFAVR